MSDTDAQAPADEAGPLSMDQIVAIRVARKSAPDVAADSEASALDASEAPEAGGEGEAGEAVEQDQAADQTADDEGAAETPSADDEAENDEPEAAAAPATDPPHFWPAEHKAEFAKVSPELQEIILTHEHQRSRTVSQAIEQATLARRQADEATQAAKDFSQRLQEALPKAERVFTHRWEGVDLLAIAEDPEQGPEVARQVRELQAAERAALAEMQEMAAKAEQEWFADFQRTETPRLLQAIPELADPAKGPKVLGKIKTLLEADGYSADEVRLASARDLRIAWEAAQFRELMASGLSKPTPSTKPAAAAPGRPVRPAASQPANATHNRELQRLENRAAQTHALEDVVAARLARRKIASR